MSSSSGRRRGTPRGATPSKAGTRAGAPGRRGLSGSAGRHASAVSGRGASARPASARRTEAPSGSSPRGGSGRSVRLDSSARIRSAAGRGRQRREEEARPRRRAGEEPSQGMGLRRVMVVLITVLAVALAILVGVLILSMTPAFTITDVEADASQHVSADNIVRLAGVEDGATLLNIDESQIVSNLERNPWVGDVHITREFPGTLKIEITERSVDALVVMNAGNVAWCLGDGNVWIEPVSLTSGDGASTNDVAVQKASELGCLLITDSPASVSPVAGSVATDATILAVQEMRQELSSDFAAQIKSFSASSAESVSCVTDAGVEISLGGASNVSTKEAIVDQILAQYPNRVVYINVRVPSKPSYRLVNTEYVEAGADDGQDGSQDGSEASDPSSQGSSDAGDGTSSAGA